MLVSVLVDPLATSNYNRGIRWVQSAVGLVESGCAGLGDRHEMSYVFHNRFQAPGFKTYEPKVLEPSSRHTANILFRKEVGAASEPGDHRRGAAAGKALI